jgi:TctA family transporter
VGGLFGTLVMIFMAPSLAEVAIKFSSFEYFWLVVLGWRAPSSSAPRRW